MPTAPGRIIEANSREINLARLFRMPTESFLRRVRHASSSLLQSVLHLTLPCRFPPRRSNPCSSLLAINFEEDMLNAVQLAPMVRQAMAAVSSARFELVPGGFGHSSIYHAELWSGPMAVFLDGLPGWKTE